MFAEWLGWVGNVLPVFLLLPLIWLVVGFLSHSIGGQEPIEDVQPSLYGYLKSAAIWLFIACGWLYLLFDAWRAHERDWFLVGGFALSAIVNLLMAAQFLVEARKFAAESPFPPRT